jgi:hypothetical protein
MGLRDLRARLARLARAVPDRVRADRLLSVDCIPARDDPDGRPPGVYPGPGGRTAVVVFGGPEPDPATLAGLRERMPPWGLVIVGDPGAG